MAIKSPEAIARSRAHSRLKMQERRDRDPKGHKDYQRRWREANKDKIKAWPSRSSAARREQRMLDRYGLTDEQITAMIAEQKGKCAICCTDLLPALSVVDHCHKTGEVRGVLCRNCNLGIGHLQDDASLCISASKYLERN